MIAELAKFEDDARTRQAMSDWTNVLLRLRSRPVRLAAQCGLRGHLTPCMPLENVSRQVTDLGSGVSAGAS